VPIMAFPEGMRSKDGRLMEFKGGLFSMAAKTKVPIVPITISHAHAVMPGNSLFPVQSGAGKIHVHIHEPIATTDGKSEAELAALVKEAFLSTLPFEQHPKDALEQPPAVPEIVIPDLAGQHNGHVKTVHVSNVDVKKVRHKLGHHQHQRQHQQHQQPHHDSAATAASASSELYFITERRQTEDEDALEPIQ